MFSDQIPCHSASTTWNHLGSRLLFGPSLGMRYRLCFIRDIQKFDSLWDCLGCPMVKRFPSNAGAVGLLPGQGAKSAHALGAPHAPPPRKKGKRTTPYTLQTKKQSRVNTVTNSIKTLKMAHIKKSLKKTKKAKKLTVLCGGKVIFSYCRKRRGQQWMRWLNGIMDSMDMNLGRLPEMVRDRMVREVWCAAVHVTWRLNNNCQFIHYTGETETLNLGVACSHSSSFRLKK